jgi:GntR family transcriptional regulator
LTTAPTSSRPSVLADDAAQPIYLRVAAHLHREIVAGLFQAGTRLPAERPLAEQLHVGRMSIRRALSHLAEEGLIVPSNGRGWFVANGALEEPPNALLSFAELGESRGLVPSSRVLSQEVRPADLNEAESLGVAPGSSLLDLYRVRCLDGLEIALHRARVPLSRAPGLEQVDFSASSLYAVLQREYSIVPTRAQCVIEGCPADESTAGLLEVAIGAALLVFSATTFDQHGSPIELSRIEYRADRYRFKATVVRSDTIFMAPA